jgi:hypothetical protein
MRAGIPAAGLALSRLHGYALAGGDLISFQKNIVSSAKPTFFSNSSTGILTRPSTWTGVSASIT